MSTAKARHAYRRRSEAERVAHVHRLCRRIEAGETLEAVCRDPSMPQPSTMRAWLNRHPELGALAAEAEAQAAEHYPPRREYHRYDEAIAAEFLARIEDGRGLREVCAERDMPVHSTVLRWMEERPAFKAAYVRARETQADRLFDLAWKIACEATDASVRVDRLKIQTLKHRIGKLAPKKYGTLKAQEPLQVLAAEAAKGGAVRFYVRHFARTPEQKVVEITEAVWGMRPPEIEALHEGIESGRIDLEALEAMKRKTLGELAEGEA